MERPKPQGVLLVGSIPLKSNCEVFRVVGQELAGRVKRIPDGETGVRTMFMEWQDGIFPEEVLAYLRRKDQAPGPGPDEYHFQADSVKDTGYDKHAIESYREFCKLRDQGIIPKDVRFQVCLPTPLNVVASLIDARYQEVIEPVYEERMAESVRRLQDAIPARDLAIQWDAALDIALLEFNMRHIDTPKPYFTKPWFSPLREGILARIVKMARLVRGDVQMGFHLCYGNKFRKHFIEPLDLGLLTDLANDISKAVEPTHPISWFHMPVPIDRKDDAYFQPLTGLQIADAELFLGVVHDCDLSGTDERIATGQRVYGKPFGVATECGLGRMQPEEVGRIIEISRAVSSAY